ncbi:enoyl-CoA hydratase/isomerase family protein [Flavimaricola marinus]|uniref:Putative enoyl-CoA hydratase n=1 Tax=Flavimaricola marinus TaxID=1819565 RepID=A0A238LIR7_9RHOB|nr:enoyl-CoA hydratase/isomerase family protein [Flavimaricola marinus]SMY09579.1 putative enoyl-CoA hydratase [Flavimaricola marinus]
MNDLLSDSDAPVVRSRVVRGVGILALNAPPSNALSVEVRQSLWDKIAGYEANVSVGAIVLMAEGRFFSSGRDLADVGGGQAEPSLADLCLRIECCSKPVVAVLHGPALSGGAELALAAHYRLATPAATIGFPAISVGLMPDAGGTQRLPRLIGVDPALRMLLSGKSITAETGRDLGLVDGLIDGDAGSAGHAFARSLIEQEKPPRPTGQLRSKLTDGAASMQVTATTRAALPPGMLMAASRIVDSIEAAMLLPFAAALEFEAAASEDCAADPDSQCLRHVLHAERRISQELLIKTDKGGRVLTEAGAAAVSDLLAAQDRAIAWLVTHGVSERAVDAAFLQWGFEIGPFGGRDKDGPDPHVRPRVTAAMAAAGARLVEAARVNRASDIDVLAVHGMGFPRRAGGPMKAVEMAGLPRLLQQMRQWAHEDPIWEPPPLVMQAGRLAGGFAAVDVAKPSQVRRE